MDPLLFWSAAILTVVCIVRSFWAKPTPGAWIAGVAALLVAAGFAGGHLVESWIPPAWSKPAYLALPTAAEGTLTLRIRREKFIHGLHGRLVMRGERRDAPCWGESVLRVSREEIASCAFTLRVEPPAEGALPHTGGKGSSVLFDTDCNPFLDAVLVDYTVTPATRAVLDKLELEVAPCASHRQDLILHREFHQMLAIGWSVLAALAGWGLLILALRWRRARVRAPSTSGPPSPSRPPTS